ncbi:MAG: hypothetical protein P4L99_21070 [Chthoniobacter sp.]|nr:hypothetical protein [Chthoniobacter sp.]
MNDFPVIFRNQWLFGLFVALLLLGLAEMGYRIGLRLYARKDEARRSQIGGVQGAILGLLALLLGFTFSMAVSRYETRREMVLKEANAAGTAWLRAGLLPEAERAPARELLRRFVETRLKYQQVGYDPALLAEGLSLSTQIENELWQHAEGAARTAPTPITATFIVALNEMIDTDAARIDAHRNQLPVAVWVLLMIVAASGCLTSAYGSGAQGARSAFTSSLLPLLITVVIIFVYDLLHSHQGVVTISQAPLVELLKNMSLPAGK